MTRIAALLLAATFIAACSERNDKQAGARQEFAEKVLVITDYGDDGALAYFPPDSSKLYQLIFSDTCKSCAKAAEAIRPSSIYDSRICHFQLTAAGSVRPSALKLSGIVDVTGVSSQPQLKFCERIK